MPSQRQIEWDSRRITGLHPESPYGASALIRTMRIAGLVGPAEMEPGMELARLLAVPLTTLDGERRTAFDIIAKRSVLILIDAYRAKPERSAAEVGWVQERLTSDIDLVLIWPRRALPQAQTFPARGSTRMYLDSAGELRRLVSPSGKRVALLVEPESGAVERLSGTNPIFAVCRDDDGSDDRGGDRTIDLGDVHH